MSSRKQIQLTVGQDITAPPGVARNGKIRIRSEAAAEVARWFGLARPRGKSPQRGKRAANDPMRVDLARIELAPGTITLITGGSGAGKSSLLQALRRIHAPARPWIDLAALRPANVPIVNCFDDQPLLETLKLLAGVGLGEAWSYLRTPAELSDGQRFRLKLAMAMHQMKEKGKTKKEKGLIACDEFAAVLDRLTAMIVARCLRRAIDAHPHIAAVLATSHDDLIEALSPDLVVRCDFGRVEVTQRRNFEKPA